MKHFYYLIITSLVALWPIRTRAAEWQDPETKVIYVYSGSEAKVKAGSHHNSDLYPGSPAATGDITIRSSITVDGKNYTVTSIGTEAFTGSIGLKSIIIPNTVKTIGKQAFYGCRGLTSVTLPNSLDKIEYLLFYFCKSLTSISIPNSVKSIASGAFRSCSSLTKVTLGNSVSIIDTGAFQNCENLKEIDFPNSVTEIYAGAFKGCKSLTNITIPSSVTYMSFSVFEYCDNLTKATILASIKRLPQRTFEGCSVLNEVCMPNTLTTIGEYAFSGCKSIENIDLPEKLATIELGAFYNCTGLMSINLPMSLKTIGGSAFSSCSGLTSTTIPNSVKTIGEYAFSGCKSLNSIIIPNTITIIEAGTFQNCTSLDSISIPNSVERIEYNVFLGCTSLKKVNMPITINYIGSSAFKNCKSLPKIDLPLRLNRIMKSTFQNCIKMSDVDLPNTITFIGDEAFSGCTSLERVNFSNSLDSICKSAFEGCKKIESISIPNDTRYIGSMAFKGCNSLSSLSLGNSLLYIGSSAFSNCGQLTTLTIPNSVTFIDSYAFGTNLKDIYVNRLIPAEYNCDVKAFASSASSSFYKTCKLHYPTSAREAYKTTAPWSYFLANEPDEPEPTLATKIEVQPIEIYYFIHDNRARFRNHLKAKILPDDVATKKVTWVSTAPEIASIVETSDLECTIQSGNGNGKHFSKGAIRATTTDGSNLSDECKLVMYWNPQNSEGGEGGTQMEPVTLSITPDKLIPFSIGNSTLLTATFNDSEMNKWGIEEGYVALKWESLNKNVVTVDSTGMAKAISAGTTQIRVTATVITEDPTGNRVVVFSDDKPEVWEAVCDVQVVANDDIITFADPEVKRICVENWDTNNDGELSKQEAAAVTDIGTVFWNSTITSFDEFRYFTGVTIIGQRAFDNCQSIQSLSLPSTIKEIGNYAITFCDKLKKLTIPASVTKIDDYAFGNNKSFKEFIVEASNPYFCTRDGMLMNKAATTFLSFPSGIEGEYIIPADIPTVNNGAFSGCSLTKLVFPNTVKSVGGWVATSCPKLTTLVYECKTMPMCAFRYNYKLVDITLTEGLTNISSEAFAYAAITRIDIPSTVKSIGDIAFYECTELKEVHSYIKEPFAIKEGVFQIYNNGNTTFTSATLYVPRGTKSKYEATDGWKNFINIVEMENGDNDIITFADAEVKRICVENWDTNGDGELSKAEAAAVTDLGQVFKENKTIRTFNELQWFTGLKSISEQAFYDCSGLTTVTIPISVTSIGSLAFSGCSGLTSVTIPNSVTNIGECAFRYCSGLTSVTIPNGVTSIESHAFQDCSGLTSITIPNSVTKIGQQAFFGCSGLTSVTIPNSVTIIGAHLNPFPYCSNLKEILVQTGNAYFTSSDNGVLFTKDMTEILAYPCARQANSYTIPNTVKVIRSGAFSGCSGLTSVTIPNSVTNIESSAFSGCSGLTSVTIPNSVTRIETTVFSGCSSLTSVTIPNSVRSIGSHFFYGCSSLTSVTIPNSVTSIGESAFERCSGLTSVTIPNSVTGIGREAFFNCIGLKEVYSMIDQPFAIDDGVFQYFDHDYKFTSATLYVPRGTKALYQSTDGWKNFTKIVETGGEEPAPEIVRNVVMEEATGTWCGWCIRGFVAMKQTKEQFGDRFIGIAVHSGDVMDIGSYYNLGLSSYPSCLIDRYGEEYDPSYLYVVENRMKVAPTAGVSVKGEWNADKTRVTATSETQFLADGDGYSVAYVLVADGLTGTSSLWNQNNAYSGRTSTDPDLQYYCNQGSPITDMVYKDVMVGSSYNSSGQNLATSFGGSVKKGDKKANSYTLSLPTSGELAAAIDKNQVYVVAIVTNPDGTIANAAKAKVGTGAKGDVNSDGVVDVADIATVISVMAKGNNDLSADVNGDGVVDVADIATIISEMAANARRLKIEY